MGKSLQIFKRDVRRILRNPVALLVTLGICIVPCLYAWINIAANWDPYENTSDVPVAVVNEDKSVAMESMGEICAGDLMIDALKENDKIGWQFVDEAEALDGVRSGKYYAAIVIPEDFTSTLTGVLDGKTDKAKLKYYVNEKLNAIAPKVTDTGASTIETQIDEKFVATVGKVVSQKLNETVDKASGNSGSVKTSLNSVLQEVRSTLSDVDSKLSDLVAGLQNASTSLDNAANNLRKFDGKGAEVANTIGGTLNNLSQVRTNANDLMADIRKALGDAAAQVSSLSTQANADISSLTGDIATAQSQINAAIRALENDLTDGQALTSKISSSRDRVRQINPTSDSGISLRNDLERDLNLEFDLSVQLTDAQTAKIDELRGIAQRLQTVADEVGNLTSNMNGKVQTATNALQGAQTSTISTSLSQISSSLDTFAGVARQIEASAKLLDPLIQQTVSICDQIGDTFDATTDALSGTQESTERVLSRVDALTDDLNAIESTATWAVVKQLTHSDPEAVYGFLEAPVTIEESRLFPVENYASGVAPFFTSLALWVGGIALIAIFKLEVDEEEVGPVRPWQAYFGRWLLLVLLGAFQAIVCCAGDLLIGIQCAHPWAFFLAAIVASFSFVNIIFSLAVAFKHIGKALAFLLIILQVPGSSGMYPIEMMPAFFQYLNPWLPFTYSNNAMREAIAGFYAHDLAYNLGILLVFVLPAILIGVSARGYLLNVNALFDRRLRETDHLMVSEPVAIEGNRFRLATVVKAVHSPKEYRETFEERSAAFERIYPRLVGRGILALVFVPLAFFVLSMVLEFKLALLGCLVAALIIICAFLIVVEYFHDRIQHKRALTDLSTEELEGVLLSTLREELMPYAPIDTILQKQKARVEREEELLSRVRRRASGWHNAHASGADTTETNSCAAPDDVSAEEAGTNLAPDDADANTDQGEERTATPVDAPEGGDAR